jgi:hypothetical protein
MGQAIGKGGLLFASGLLLACNHERVDLGGYGAGGSSSPSLLVSRGFPTPAAGRYAPTIAAGPAPATSNLSTTPPPSPFVGVKSRAELTPPIVGGTLAVAADGGLAVLSDPDRNALFVVDPVKSFVRKVALPLGSEPGRVVLDDMRQAHVVLRSASALARVDLDSMKVSVSGPLCQQPRGIAYAADTKSLHVACADGDLLQLSAADHSELARERREPDLRDILVGPGGVRIVSRFRSAELLWLAPSNEYKASAPVLPWPRLTNGASGSELSSVNTAATFGFRIQMSWDGQVWMLHERAQVDALDADAHYHGQATGCGPVVQPALTMFGNTSAGVLATEYDLQLQGVAAPAVDLAFSSVSNAWVAFATPSAYAAGRATVQLQQRELLQKQALIRPREADAEFKTSPAAECPQPSFIALEVGSQAVAVAFDQNGLLYVQSRYPARLDVYQPIAANPSTGMDATARWTSLIDLATDDVRDLGQEWFHAELGTSHLSCAACHAEGLDDGHTWIAGTKARRTPNLRGGIKQTAPFYWDGAFASFAALVTDVITRQVFAPNISAEASDAMLSWLDRLPAFSLSTLDPTAMGGKTLFGSNALGCTSCHNGPQLTNNQTVSMNADTEDAGVADEALQVPSLLGLALRAPYMHDGCASDLSVLFHDPACARAVHKKLAAMSGTDATALQAYLLSQ